VPATGKARQIPLANDILDSWPPIVSFSLIYCPSEPFLLLFMHQPCYL